MITSAILIVTLFGVLPLLLPRVDTLPWGLDTVLTTFMSSVNVIIDILPFMATIWHVFVIALSIKVAMLTYTWGYKLLKLIRGGG